MGGPQRIVMRCTEPNKSYSPGRILADADQQSYTRGCQVRSTSPRQNAGSIFRLQPLALSSVVALADS